MLTQFLDYLRYELNRAGLTVDAYRNDIEQFSHWLSGSTGREVDYFSVTTNDVRAWLAGRAKKGDTPRTLRRKIISLRSFFKWMQKTGKISRSPLQNVALPKIGKPLPEIVRPREIETALKEIEQGDIDEEKKLLNYLIVEMLYTLGIRRAELIGLNDSDVSVIKSELKVTGKRSKQRIIPVPQRLMAHIEKWQHTRDRNQSSEETDKPLLMVKGKRISAGQVYHIVKKSLQNSGARKKSPHALRHSFASGMLNGGAEIDSVREFLGHSSLATTQIYTHISIQEIKKAYIQAHPRMKDNKK